MTTTTDSKKEIPDSPVIDLIRNTVRQQEPDAEIILYGSRARGDARPDSDWDVLILRNKQKLDPLERGTISYNLFLKGLEELNQEINAREYTKTEWETTPVRTLFQYNVKREGIRL